MNSAHASSFLLLVFAALFSCTGFGQSTRTQATETDRLDLREQVTTGQSSGKETGPLTNQEKQDQIQRQPAGDNARADQPPRAAGKPALFCQTYPDGRTECR